MNSILYRRRQIIKMHILVLCPYLVIPIAAIIMTAVDTYGLIAGRPTMTLYDIRLITYALTVFATLASFALMFVCHVCDGLAGLFGILQAIRARRKRTSAPGRKINDIYRELQHDPSMNGINLKNMVGYSTLQGAFR